LIVLARYLFVDDLLELFELPKPTVEQSRAVAGDEASHERFELLQDLDQRGDMCLEADRDLALHVPGEFVHLPDARLRGGEHGYNPPEPIPFVAEEFANPLEVLQDRLALLWIKAIVEGVGGLAKEILEADSVVVVDSLLVDPKDQTDDRPLVGAEPAQGIDVCARDHEGTSSLTSSASGLRPRWPSAGGASTRLVVKLLLFRAEDAVGQVVRQPGCGRRQNQVQNAADHVPEHDPSFPSASGPLSQRRGNPRGTG